MRTRLFVTLALLATVLAPAETRAQAAKPQGPPPAGNGEIRGIVLDAKDSTPLNRVSVTVRHGKDSSLAGGALTNAAGQFRVQGLRNGAYSVRITTIGFSPVVQRVTLSDSQPTATLRGITLGRFAVALSGVEVTEDRATMAIEPDRNSYNAKDVAPAAANTSEVLEQVPSVAIDADGKVSLRGNENVVIQINGRPTPIAGSQLGNYLKSIPASVLDRVEVVPNPSAKYDPEGMAGIINIVLKANTDLGFSGGLNASAASAERFSGSGNLGYQVGKLTTFTNYGYNADDRSIRGINDRERLDALKKPLQFTNQDIASVNGNAGHNLAQNVDYKLNARDVLSNALALNFRQSSDNTFSAYEELGPNRTITDRYDRLKGTSASGAMVDYNLAFKRTFEARRHEWSAETRYNWSNEKDDTQLWRQAPASASQSERENNVTDAVTRQFNAQTDYMRQFAARTKIEAGAKSTTRWLDRDYQVEKDMLGNDTWVPSNLSNGLSFSEMVNAAYVVMSHGAGPLDLQAGLRAEQASRDFKLDGSTTTYPYNYASVFPSGVVLWNANDKTQLKTSYSRRIRRPGTQELNPFPSFFDIQNVFIGNPNLNPEYTDALEFGLMRTGALGTLQVSPFFRHTSNIIRVNIDTDARIDGRDVTTVSFNNLATSNSWGTDVNGSFKFSPRLSGFTGFNVFKMVTDGGSLSSLGSNAVAWMARLSLTSELTKTITFQGNYQYRAPMKIEGGEFAAVHNINFSTRMKLDGGSSIVGIRVLDPFSTNRFRITAGNSNLIQLTERNPGVRGVFLFYQYNFGQVPRVRQARPEDSQQSQAGFP